MATYTEKTNLMKQKLAVFSDDNNPINVYLDAPEMFGDGVLLNHNKTAYLKVVEGLKHKGVAVVEIATSLGKSYLALKLINDMPAINPNNQRVVVVEPKKGIGQQFAQSYKGVFGHGIRKNKDVQIVNYQGLASVDKSGIPFCEKKDQYGLIILDEVHHIGGEVWEKNIQKLIKNNPNAKVFAMTATLKRMDKKDVLKTLGGKDALVYQKDLAHAINEGILPPIEYHLIKVKSSDEVIQRELEKISMLRRAGYKISGDLAKKEKALNAERKKAVYTLKAVDVIKAVIINRQENAHGKYVVFCPPGLQDSEDENSRLVMEELIRKAREEWFPGKKLHIYAVHSRYNGLTNADAIKMGYMLGDVNKEDFNLAQLSAFDNDDDKDAIKLIFSVNMFLEGIHPKGVTGALSCRTTQSGQIFVQQLGRVCNPKSKKMPIFIDMVEEFNAVEDAVAFLNSSKGEKHKPRTPGGGGGDGGNGGGDNEPKIPFEMDEDTKSAIELASLVKQVSSELDRIIGENLRDEVKISIVEDFIEREGRLPTAIDNLAYKDDIVSPWYAFNVIKKSHPEEAKMLYRKALTKFEEIQKNNDDYYSNGGQRALLSFSRVDDEYINNWVNYLRVRSACKALKKFLVANGRLPSATATEEDEMLAYNMLVSADRAFDAITEIPNKMLDDRDFKQEANYFRNEWLYKTAFGALKKNYDRKKINEEQALDCLSTYRNVTKTDDIKMFRLKLCHSLLMDYIHKTGKWPNGGEISRYQTFIVTIPTLEDEKSQLEAEKMRTELIDAYISSTLKDVEECIKKIVKTGKVNSEEFEDRQSALIGIIKSNSSAVANLLDNIKQLDEQVTLSAQGIIEKSKAIIADCDNQIMRINESKFNRMGKYNSFSDDGRHAKRLVELDGIIEQENNKIKKAQKMLEAKDKIIKQFEDYVDVYKANIQKIKNTQQLLHRAVVEVYIKNYGVFPRNALTIKSAQENGEVVLPLEISASNSLKNLSSSNQDIKQLQMYYYDNVRIAVERIFADKNNNTDLSRFDNFRNSHYMKDENDKDNTNSDCFYYTKGLIYYIKVRRYVLATGSMPKSTGKSEIEKQAYSALVGIKNNLNSISENSPYQKVLQNYKEDLTALAEGKKSSTPNDGGVLPE